MHEALGLILGTHFTKKLFYLSIVFKKNVSLRTFRYEIYKVRMYQRLRV
jgi:hypothetical protein